LNFKGDITFLTHLALLKAQYYYEKKAGVEGLNVTTLALGS